MERHLEVTYTAWREICVMSVDLYESSCVARATWETVETSRHALADAYMHAQCMDSARATEYLLGTARQQLDYFYEQLMAQPYKEDHKKALLSLSTILQPLCASLRACQIVTA